MNSFLLTGLVCFFSFLGVVALCARFLASREQQWEEDAKEEKRQADLNRYLGQCAELAELSVRLGDTILREAQLLRGSGHTYRIQLIHRQYPQVSNLGYPKLGEPGNVYIFRTSWGNQKSKNEPYAQVSRAEQAYDRKLAQLSARGYWDVNSTQVVDPVSTLEF